MHIEILEKNGQRIAVVQTNKMQIQDPQSAFDLMTSILYEKDCDRMIIDQAALSDTFFDLKTGFAGEVLQKFIQYQMKIAIVGDFSQYSSKSLQAFIVECNRGKDIFFLPEQMQALERLSDAP